MSSIGTIGLTGQALALHNLPINGLIVRTATGVVAARSLSGTARISVSNGDGVSGDPTIDIAQNAATLGQVLKWNGTNWAPATDNNGGGTVAGSGTLNRLARWTSATSLGTGATFDNGTNVGLGTTSPQAKLHVKNGSVLFEGTSGNTPINGPGTRMMWIPSKAAFRAGVVTGSTWNNANIGSYSVAFGYNTTASGWASSALGNATIASGAFSTAFGYGNTASGAVSSVFGYGSTAQSFGSFVIGRYNIISGNPQVWVATDPLFVISNGLSSSARANAMTVLKNGNVGIGTTVPSAKLHVIVDQNLSKAFVGAITTNGVTTENFVIYGDGHVFARDIKVKLGSLAHPDYVFESNYKLRTLTELEAFLKKNHHLPNVPSTCELAANEGINLGEMSEIQLQKIEELTLYIIEINKKMTELQTKIQVQQQQIQKILNK